MAGVRFFCGQCQPPWYNANMMKRPIFTILVALTVSACQQTAPKFYGTFSAQDKTIAVPALSNLEFASALKDNLRQDGWRITISGATAEQGVTARINRTAKYSLDIAELKTSAFSSSNVNITIFENESGAEIMTYHGKVLSIDKQARKMVEAIRAHTK